MNSAQEAGYGHSQNTLIRAADCKLQDEVRSLVAESGTTEGARDGDDQTNAGDV